MYKNRGAVRVNTSIILVFVLIFALPVLFLIRNYVGSNDIRSDASTTPGLTINNTTLTSTNGQKFIIKGVNMEYYRDNGCSYVTEYATKQASQIVEKYKSLGINAVRLNYKSSWLSQGSNLSAFLTMMQSLANNGIYVMPSDHSFTGKVLTGFETTSYPMFKAIVEGARSRGFEDYVIMNPYNEPYGGQTESTWANWIKTNQATLDYLRKTLGFNGIIVLDTKDWAGQFDKASLQTVMAYDANLLGGKKAVVFANHWYPNHDYSTRVKPTFDAANQIPLLIGEVGQINPGVTKVDEGYIKNVFANLISSGINNGHNGAFPWMWAWCDENNMTKDWDDEVNLSTYGQLIVDNYYSKVQSSSPLVTPSANPSATQKPSSTPLATIKPTPVTTGTPKPTIKPTATNAPSGSSTSTTSSKVVATVRIDDEWQQGYCATIVVKNSLTTAVSSWTVIYNLNQATINQKYNATFNLKGSVVTVIPNSSIKYLPANGTNDAVDYCATKTGANWRPSQVSVIYN